MQVSSLALVLTSVLMTAAAQLLLRAGASATNVREALSSSVLTSAVHAVATSPFILAGLFCLAASAATWIVALSKLDVSYAYPFVALGIVITVVGGHFIIGEPMTIGRIGGVLLIAAGVIVLAASS